MPVKALITLDSVLTTSFEVLDWRRRVHALYAAVRAEADPPSSHAIWRAGREDLFRTHPASPLAPGHRLAYAPYDPALRWVLPVAEAPPERREVDTATDGVVPFERVGRLDLGALGTLEVWWLESYGGGVFVPLKDATAGPTSYGGGRYLLDTVKGADLGGDRDALVVDLNFAYNPSCAYDPAWVCPLAPPGNTLAAPVHAGELLPVPG
jgi:uncharacterized protein